MGLCNHPKTKKVIRRLGYEGFFCLVNLWCWAAQNRIDGAFENMSIEDIEIAANWNGEYKKLVTQFVDIGFIGVNDDDEFFLHDWEEHQPWIVRAESRSMAARLSKLAQHDRKKFQELKESGVKGLTKSEYDDLVLGGRPQKKQRNASETQAERQHSASDSLAPLLSSPIHSSPLLSPSNVKNIPPKKQKRNQIFNEYYPQIVSQWKMICDTWNLPAPTGGKACEKLVRDYIETEEDAKRAIKGLEGFIANEPGRFYSGNPKVWKLEWFFRKQDSNKNHVDRIQGLVDGEFFEKNQPEWGNNKNQNKNKVTSNPFLQDLMDGVYDE